MRSQFGFAASHLISSRDRARLVLLQNADDLFVCKTVGLHSLVLSMGQSLLKMDYFKGGNLIARRGAIGAALIILELFPLIPTG